jgi:hypothetical protein
MQTYVERGEGSIEPAPILKVKQSVILILTTQDLGYTTVIV